MTTCMSVAKAIRRLNRPHKYGARRTEVDGIKFDSKAEAERYGVLKIFEQAGAISDLKIHPRYPIEVNGERVCIYVADFAYRDVCRGTTVVEDVKGTRTAAFILKKKLMWAVHGIEVREVR